MLVMGAPPSRGMTSNATTQILGKEAADRFEPAHQVLERLAGNAGARLCSGVDVVAALVGVQEREQVEIAGCCSA